MDSGEASRKKTNEDETDRPLKKAKYLWQVKGKYHLKDNQTTNQTSNVDASKNEKKVSEANQKHQNLVNGGNGGKNKHKNQNNNKKQNVCNDRSCIEEILANSDKFMEFSLIDSPPTRKNIDKSISDEIPITLVKPNPKTDDYYLRKWQARQIAKGFLDNTINRVLEYWMVAPFDAADFVENCDNGGQIEDEGILMAIQSHGLQSGKRPSLFHCNTRNNWEAQANCTCSSKAPGVTSVQQRQQQQQHHQQRGVLTPFHQRAAAEHQNLSDFHLKYYEVEEKPTPLLEMKCQSATEIATTITSTIMSTSTTTITPALVAPVTPVPPITPITSVTPIAGQLIATKIHETNVNVNSCSSYDPLKMNDTDFLDAAVAVAIQKKGLTSLNCVDCG